MAYSFNSRKKYHRKDDIRSVFNRDWTFLFKKYANRLIIPTYFVMWTFGRKSSLLVLEIMVLLSVQIISLLVCSAGAVTLQTAQPSVSPTSSVPTATVSPSNEPSRRFHFPTRRPTSTHSPTQPPTYSPSHLPTERPTSAAPTISPSRLPTTSTPTASPTAVPTFRPSHRPTTTQPTSHPSAGPTGFGVPLEYSCGTAICDPDAVCYFQHPDVVLMVGQAFVNCDHDYE